jgi:hypothetical protein
MSVMRIAGVLLLAIGVWFVVRPPTYSREESLFRVGNIEATMHREHTVPGWLGGAAIGGGVVLLLLSLARR